MSDPSRVEDVFSAALDKRTAEERAAYLDEVFADSFELRQAVERLLAAHDKTAIFWSSHRAGYCRPPMFRQGGAARVQATIRPTWRAPRSDPIN